MRTAPVNASASWPNSSLSITVSGRAITGAGFITLAATLSVVPSVPVAGMALILGIDRFMSECRALTNLVGNAVATIVVARWENELDADQLAKALDGKVIDSLPATDLQPAE